MQKCFYLKKKKKKGAVKTNFLSVFEQKNVNLMSKWDENVVFDANLQTHGCLS